MLHDLLVLLHIASISAWLAASIWLAGDVRRVLALGRPHVDALAERLAAPLKLDGLAAMATFVTGGLIVWEQHLGMPRAGITAGILLAVARGGVLAALRRGWKSIHARVQTGEAVGADDPAARRLSMLAGIAHTLWLLALAGMVLPI
jgi:hypothetical protein